MYEKVLVPLDGSELAECALPHAVNLVREGVSKEVILLSVVDIPMTTEKYDYSSLGMMMSTKAEKYLDDVQSRLESEGVKADTDVVEGTAASSIIEYANKKAVDLIVIASHGYTGINKLMFGSVALRVLHDSHVPVLLIRPPACEK